MTNQPDWREERQRVAAKVEALREQGICYSCRDLETGEVFGQQSVVFEDDLFKVVLDDCPRATGHTIVVYKPHREDFTELSDDENAPIFQMCTHVA